MTNNNHSTVAHKTVWNKVFTLAQRFPQAYMAFVVPIALLGYVFLLFFPVMFVFSTGKFLWILGTTPAREILAQTGPMVIWICIAVICVFVTRQIMQISFKPPEGITISEKTALKLHGLISHISKEITIPKIDRIIITEQLSVDIAKTPNYPLPIWSTNTLVVGLPMMQCLSPEYFRCALVRKLIQHSKENHALPKWLAQLRTIWSQYIKATSPKHSRHNVIVHYFFRFYAPIYKFLSIPVANHVELLADQDALRIINDEDLFQTIEKVIVTKIYLEKQYWPKIQNMVSHNRYQLIEPYSKLEQVLQTGLTPQMSKRWLDMLYCSHPSLISSVPDLRSRMNNIGRSKIRIPEKINETAAHYFLDNAYRDIITEINQMWMVRSNNIYDQTNITRPAATQLPIAERHSKQPATRMNMNLFN